MNLRTMKASIAHPLEFLGHFCDSTTPYAGVAEIQDEGINGRPLSLRGRLHIRFRYTLGLQSPFPVQIRMNVALSERNVEYTLASSGIRLGLLVFVC
jgi:hypothetical protein